jgi:hypothetical protein
MRTHHTRFSRFPTNLLVTLIASIVLLTGRTIVTAQTNQAGAAPADDMAKVQGKWERSGSSISRSDPKGTHHVGKEIRGSEETITYYAQDDLVLGAHRVEFKLEKNGPVGLFTYFNLEITAGQNKGSKEPRPNSYIYRVDNNTFAEVWGFLPGQEQRTPELMVWTRVRATDADPNKARIASEKKPPESPKP